MASGTRSPRLDSDGSAALAPVPGEPGPAKEERRARGCHGGTIAGMSSPYDAIARVYDPWSRSVVEDVAFYVEEARASGGPVVELGVGTGRIAVPIAAAGVRVIGVDDSQGMLDVCSERAAAAGVTELVELRRGDLRRPAVAER